MYQQTRDFLNQHQGVSVAIMAVAIVACLGFIVMRIVGVFSGGEEQERPPLGYFYDQNTKTLFVKPANEQLPVATDSGLFEGEPAGVRAHVLACGQCSDESARFIGWLEKPLPPEEAPPPDDPNSELTLIRRETDTQWVRTDSDEAQKIMAEARERCSGGAQLNYCRPDSE